MGKRLFGPRTRTDIFPRSLSFAGQSVLVTGVTNRLGLGAVIQYVKLGANLVVITARTAGRGVEAHKTFGEHTRRPGSFKSKYLKWMPSMA
jgi:hypothetical protein